MVTAPAALRVLPDAQALALAAADHLCAAVRAEPELVLLVATGNTPMPTYAELARRVAAGEADFSRAVAVQLDEYLDLTEGDPRGLWAWMQRSFVGPLGIRRAVRLTDPARYEAEVHELGGIGLAILGLGPNGHLGFNEPPSPADAPTRAVTLSPESLASNRAYWGGLPTPTRAVTAGMNIILAARETVLLVSGAHKRDVLRRTLQEPPAPEVPASLLRGTRLTVYADREAAP